METKAESDVASEDKSLAAKAGAKITQVVDKVTSAATDAGAKVGEMGPGREEGALRKVSVG